MLHTYAPIRPLPNVHTNYIRSNFLLSKAAFTLAVCRVIMNTHLSVSYRGMELDVKSQSSANPTNLAVGFFFSQLCSYKFLPWCHTNLAGHKTPLFIFQCFEKNRTLKSESLIGQR